MTKACFALRYAVLLIPPLAVPHAVNQLAAATGPGFSVDLAHWAANGGWNSRWSVVNTSASPLSCTLDLVGPDGQPVSLNTTAGSGNSISFTVAQGGTTIIQAGGAAGSVQSGASTMLSWRT